MKTVECTVCGEEVGKAGIGKHAGVHRREFRKKFGRPPEDYDEVREALGGHPPGDQATIAEYAGGDGDA